MGSELGVLARNGGAKVQVTGHCFTNTESIPNTNVKTNFRQKFLGLRLAFTLVFGILSVLVKQ